MPVKRTAMMITATMRQDLIARAGGTSRSAASASACLESASAARREAHHGGCHRPEIIHILRPAGGGLLLGQRPRIERGEVLDLRDQSAGSGDLIDPVDQHADRPAALGVALQ